MKALFPFIFNENYNDFLLYLGFFQVQIKKGDSRLLRATVGETNPVNFELFLSATPKGWKKISVISRCRVLCWIFWKKNVIKKFKHWRTSPDPESSWCDHQQPYNFFSVFNDFLTLLDNTGEPNLVDSKQKKLAVTRDSFFCFFFVFFFWLSLKKFFKADRK